MPILVPFFPCFVRPHRSEGHQGLPVISQVLAQKPTAATTQPRVLVCRKRKNGVDLSVKSSSRTGWIGRLLHGRELARLQRRLGWEIAWCEKHLGHWPEVGAALELLQSERAASPDRCLNTVKLRAALQVLKAAQGRFLDITRSAKDMRAHRDGMKAMAPSELRACILRQDGHSAARTADRDEARACNRAWAQAVPDGASGGGGLLASLGTFLGAALGAPGRATGGPVSPGRAYRVGERGPELFVPTTSGRIETGGAVGAPTQLRLTINVSDSGKGSAPAALERSSRHVARAVRQALARD